MEGKTYRTSAGFFKGELTFGTLMKQLVFGGLSQIMVLAREDHSAKEVKKQSSKLLLPFLQMRRKRKKHLLSFGSLRVRDASRE